MAAGLGSGVAGTAVSGGPDGPDAAIHLRRYTQITQRQQPIGERWTATDKRDQLEHLKQYYANPASLRGEQDPHSYLGQRVANTFAEDNHTILHEGTIIAYHGGNYGVVFDLVLGLEFFHKLNRIVVCVPIICLSCMPKFSDKTCNKEYWDFWKST